MLKKMLIGILVLLGLIVLVFTLMLFRLGATSRSMEVSLGHDAGQLLVCPDSPNCVSSQADPADSHYINAIEDLDGSKWERLQMVLNGMDGATEVSSEGNYAYYTFQTRLMGFVDDVEFFYAPEQSLIHVRSASRVGQSDLNANRKRLEIIRTAL
jgi:uncharacterized protein (DUF1499 family)